MAFLSDSHTNAINLTNINSTANISDGIIGNNAEFDALNSQSLIVAGGAPSELLTFLDTGFSITAWVKLYDLLNIYCVFGKGTLIPDYTKMEYFLVFDSVSGLWQFNIGNGIEFSSVQHTTPAVANVWTFLTVRYNALIDTMYITSGDPSSNVVTQIYTGGSYASGLDFSIGKAGADDTWFMNGGIDEVGIYNGTLSDAQLVYLFNGSLGRTYPFII